MTLERRKEEEGEREERGREISSLEERRKRRKEGKSGKKEDFRSRILEIEYSTKIEIRGELVLELVSRTIRGVSRTIRGER